MNNPALRRTLLVTVLLVGAVLTAVPPSRAGGGGSCTFDPATHIATASPFNQNSPPSDMTVIRDGADTIRVNGIACGTVTTLDKMVFNWGSAGADLTFMLGGGPFAPGFVSQSGDSGEIEFEVNYDDQFNLGFDLEILGSDARDVIRLGESFILGGGVTSEINLNADVDQDSDIFINARMDSFEIEAFGGDDEIAGAGLGTLFSGPTSGDMFVEDGAGSDLIVGGGGDDRLTATMFKDEPDVYIGGVGRDNVSYRERSSAVGVTFDGNANDGVACPGSDCEGDDFGEGIDGVFGTEMSDTLVGGPGAQTLFADEGHNKLRGLGGKDFLIAGNGNDDFRGGAGFDTVGRSSATGWGSNDPGLEITIDDKPGDGVPGENDNVHTDVESLIGTISRDVLSGSDKADSLYGGGNNDTLRGGPGNDTLNGGNNYVEAFGDGDDVYFGGGGRDTVEFSVADYHLDGVEVSLDNVANDGMIGNLYLGIDNVRSDVEDIIGSAGPDKLVGSAGNNRLVGKAGNDLLRGLGGNDNLLGGVGDDTLQGGPGEDSCQQADGTGATSGCES